MCAISGICMPFCVTCRHRDRAEEAGFDGAVRMWAVCVCAISGICLPFCVNCRLRDRAEEAGFDGAVRERLLALLLMTISCTFV